MKIRCTRWIAAFSFCIILIASAVCFEWMRGNPIKINTEPASDIALSTVASLLVIQKDSSALSQVEGTGVLDAYEHDVEPFKRDAHLMKTFMASAQAADFVRQSGAFLPTLTNESSFPTPILDAWGNPMCVVGSPTDIVIVSNGENAKPVRCASTGLSSELLKDVPRNRLIRSERGYLISIFPRKSVSITPPENRH